MSITAPHIFYEVAMSRLEAQMNQIEAIDRKLAVFLGFASAILAVFAAGFQIIRVTQEWPLCVLVLSGITVAIYIALVVFALLAYKFMRWSYRPDLETLKKYCSIYNEAPMKQWVAKECILSIKTNESKIASKTSAAQKVIWLLGAETITLAVSFLLLLYLN